MPVDQIPHRTNILFFFFDSMRQAVFFQINKKNFESIYWYRMVDAFEIIYLNFSFRVNEDIYLHSDQTIEEKTKQ